MSDYLLSFLQNSTLYKRDHRVQVQIPAFPIPHFTCKSNNLAKLNKINSYQTIMKKMEKGRGGGNVGYKVT